ncbi:MAG: ankyrin repeat domain-containing protein [Planctomycetaceae bacterium]|jgi:hypothetical protein|nr:ankyrin repeat domain-containing protein [Planctomycetaceae bacterium]
MRLLGEGISVVFMSAANCFYYDDEQQSNFLPIVLKYGGDPNIVYTEYNVTPIFAACNPSKSFGNALKSRDRCYLGSLMEIFYLPSPRNVALLIETGVDIEFRDKWQNTPLIAAAGGENFDIVLMLLEAGADYTAENEDGENLAYFLYAAKHMNPEIDTEQSVDPYYNKVIDFLKAKEYSLNNAYAKLRDKLKRLPVPPENSNIRWPYQRPFDPFADEWIQKRKQESAEKINAQPVEK